MTTSKSQRVDMIIGINDKVKWWQNIVYAIQQLSVDTTILILPILLARALNLPPSASQIMLQASLIGAGIVTICQALFILKLPVLQGPAIVFVSVTPAVAIVAGLPATWTGIILASLLCGVLSILGLWGKTRQILGAAPVYGTVILLAGITISSTIFSQIVGQPNTPNFGHIFNFVEAFIPFAIAVVIVILIPKSFVRLISLLIAAVIAVAVAALNGQMNLSAVGTAHWIGIPAFLPFGFEFNAGAFIVMFLVLVADLGQVVGNYLLVGEVMGEQTVSNKRIDGGIMTESFGSALGAAFGGLPTVTYNQNIGAISVTGIGSRFVFATAGAILIVLGLIPKIAAVVSAIPGPVIGGLLLVTIAMLCMQAVRVLGSMDMTNANMFTAGTAIVVGMGVGALPKEFIATLPALIRPFVASGIVMGFLTAVILYVIFNYLLPKEASQTIDRPTESSRSTN